MILSDFRKIVEGLEHDENFQLSLKLRDKLYRNGVNGMPLSLAKKTASLVTLGSKEEKFIDEVAGLLCNLSSMVIPELGEEAFLLVLKEIPTFYKD